MVVPPLFRFLVYPRRVPCIFCEIVAGRAPASVVFADERVVAFLDIHPWRPGHTLVVPRAHAVRLGELAPADRAALASGAFAVAAALRASELPCDDLNLWLADGPAANQTVAHVHMHVVPRRRGDTLRLAARLVTELIRPIATPAPRAMLDAQAAGLAAVVSPRR